MPRGTIDWKSPDSYTRLLAAMVAAQDMKLNYKKIADMYGEGATYDAIEGRFRIIKKEAAKLKEEIESGARPEAPPRGGQGTPRVLTGRVSKSVNSTPTKRRAGPNLHVEQLDSSASSTTNDESVVFTPSESASYSTNSFADFGTYSFDLTHLDDSVDPFMTHNWEDEHVA